MKTILEIINKKKIKILIIWFKLTEDLIHLYKLEFKIMRIKDYYFSDIYKSIGKNKKDDFKKIIQSSNYGLEENWIDNFDMASFNSTILISQIKKSAEKTNLYNNIWGPLSKKILL